MKSKNMKLISFVLLFSLLLTGVVMPSGMAVGQTQQPISIFVNGEILVTDTPPIIESGRTLVPLRAIFERLEAAVEWDALDRKVTATREGTTIVLYIGNATAWVNGAPVVLDVPPKIVNSRTLVPLRFVSESFGAEVDWDGLNRIVTVVTQTEAPEVPDFQLPGFNLPGINLSLLPDWVKNGLLLAPNDRTYDTAKIHADSLTVQKDVDLSLLQPSQDWSKPPYALDSLICWSTGCDYTPYVTFTGNQDGRGGCIGRSMVHIMNILKEREHPYTPDVSFWYLHGRQEELADGGPVNTKFVLEQNGIAPEASSHSDYDKVIIGKDAAGNSTYDYSQMPRPNGWTNYLASYYRMQESGGYEPTIENIRHFLRNYGPLLAGGDIPLIQGDNPEQGHAVTIVGYDDVTKTVKCLNSWGDTWGDLGNGYFTVPYDALEDNFNYVRFYQVIPVERAGTDQAYSARIHVETGADSRNKLKVTLGVDGRSPFTVWDTPNETLWIDYSKTLKLDVPLPIYAVDYWPPATGTHWYVEVTNNSTWDPAVLKEITFARLHKNPDGSYATETFKSTESGATIAPGETKKFYVPKKTTIIDLPIVPIVPILPIR
ncbi:stalk domain-containing protein [Anaerotalea alkaliphila]|nr:stalk domain-containing protein [Anaerotalea alkaliphila]